MTAELNQLLRRLTTVAVFFAAAVIVISAVERKESSQVENVVVQISSISGDSTLIKPSDIMQTIERSFGYELTSLPVGDVDIARLEKVLEEDPIIADAEAFVDADNKVTIKITQRDPVLRVIDRNGLNYYLDANGAKMPLSKHYTPRVLVATGNIPPHTPDFLQRKRHLLKDLFELAGIIRKDEFLNALVEQIYVNNRGELTLVPKIGDQLILFGRMVDAEDKLKRLKVFYLEALPYEGWQRYATINLKFKGQVVCEKR